jgi:hypothetical protein
VAALEQGHADEEREACSYLRSARAYLEPVRFGVFAEAALHEGAADARRGSAPRLWCCLPDPCHHVLMRKTWICMYRIFPSSRTVMLQVECGLQPRCACMSHYQELSR